MTYSTKINPKSCTTFLRSLCTSVALLSGAVLLVSTAFAQSEQPRQTSVIVQPKFGGQIIGFTVDPTGKEGLLSEASSADGNTVATEIFDQATGKIIKVVAEEKNTQNDYATEEINAPDLGLVLYQQLSHGSFVNSFFTLNPLTTKKFTGKWTPHIRKNYQLAAISVAQGSEVAVFENNLNAGSAYVFGSNIAKNISKPAVSLASIISVDEFLVNPQIALDPHTNQAVLADSHDCPEPNAECATSVALVNLNTGVITEFNDKLGVGQLNGLAVDPVTGIAVTTTLVDQGVEFYNLATQTGKEVIIPNHGSEIQAGLDVEFDPIHKLFLVSQYSSTGNINDPQPRVYVYNEKAEVVGTVALQQRIGIGSRIALNPTTRTGFLDAIVEPQNLFLQLQSFSY